MVWCHMKKIIIGILVLFVCTANAYAQSGSSKTPAALAAETNALWPDNTVGLITPYNARQTLLDIIASYASLPARVQLLLNTTFYVNGDPTNPQICGTAGQFTGPNACVAGNDSNTCLSPSQACLTVQHVVNILLRSTDFAGFTATINLAYGSSNNYAFRCTFGPIVGQSVFTVTGDSVLRTAVTMVATTAAAAVKDLCTVNITNVAMADNASNNAVAFVSTGTGSYGHVDLQNITFGPLAIGTALTASYAGSITLVGANAITGSENAFIDVSYGGAIEIDGTVAGSAGITWGTAAVVGQEAGTIVGVTGATFTGFSGVSGPRCFMSSVPSPDSVNPNSVFPGSTDCIITQTVGALGVQKGSGNSSTIDYGTNHWPYVSGGAGPSLGKYEQLVNAGIAPGAANTVKGTTDGVTEADLTPAQVRAIVAPTQIFFTLTGVNFNPAPGTDNAIALALPAGMTRFVFVAVRISHATHTLTTATAGIFVTTGGGGPTVAADQALTLSATTDATNNNAQGMAFTNTVTQSFVL